MPQPNVAAVASSFRNLLIGVLASLTLTAVNIGLNLSGMGQDMAVTIGLLVVSLALSIYLVIQVIATTKALGWSVGATIACAVAMFIPCVRLIVLLVISQAAVKALKAGGYKVGLLGAKM
jgi:hypothetical protein